MTDKIRVISVIVQDEAELGLCTSVQVVKSVVFILYTSNKQRFCNSFLISHLHLDPQPWMLSVHLPRDADVSPTPVGASHSYSGTQNDKTTPLLLLISGLCFQNWHKNKSRGSSLNIVYIFSSKLIVFWFVIRRTTFCICCALMWYKLNMWTEWKKWFNSCGTQMLCLR